MNIPKQLQEKYQTIFLYGSVVYKTASKDSDLDLIVIGNSTEQSKFDNIDINAYTPLDFQKALDNHEVWALEAFFSIPIKGSANSFSLNINPQKIRESFSKKASHSWVKAKKKIEKENEVYKGQKSIFHSLRILDFAIQILKHGKIINYGSSNHLWDKIKDEPNWTNLEKNYKQLFNKRRSVIRSLAPTE